MKRLVLALALAGAAVPTLAAQTPAADSAAPAPAPSPPAPPRAGWLSDRLPLRVGDLLTVLVSEEAAASERVSTNATANRSQRARLGIGVDESVRLGPSKEFSTGMENSSRDVGETGRKGELSAVLTVRVTSIDANGLATIEGSKSVIVDKRTQQIQLTGVVRAEDVSPRNVIPSSRVADAVITYNGKRIGPKSGILGKILSIFWP